jgi:hypothetical protein
VLSNPQGDFGRVLVTLDGEPLFNEVLENFRSLDYHFVSPIVAGSDQTIAIEVTCNKPGEPPEAKKPNRCDTNALLGGDLVEPQPKQP